jgi:hypothetical protein
MARGRTPGDEWTQGRAQAGAGAPPAAGDDRHPGGEQPQQPLPYGRRRRTAASALIAMLVALCFGALFNAPAMKKTALEMPFGGKRSVRLALVQPLAAVSRWLDAGLGPDGRRWIYAQMVKDRPLLLRFNNQGIPRWEDAFLRALYAAVTPYVLRRLRVNDATIDTDGARVRHAFDEVARRLSDGRPFLCGERFTAADLTFACLAAPVLMPPHCGVACPNPRSCPGCSRPTSRPSARTPRAPTR